MSDETKALIAVIQEGYKDIAQPTARVIGNALGKVAGLALEPVGALADIGRSNLMRFVKKLEKEERESPGNIIPTKPSVAVPILEKMRYVDEDTLAEAYAELLKNSCLKDRQAKVLPAYSEILARLSSDEVKILDFIYRKKNFYHVLIKDVMKSVQDEFKQKYGHTKISHEELESVMPYPIDGIPYLEVRNGAINPKEGFRVVVKYFTDINKKIALSNSENLEIYIENLRSLGIFNIGLDTLFSPISVYDCLVQEAARNYRSDIEQHNRKMELLKGQIELTPLAKSFLAMCTSSKRNGESNAPPV